MLEGEIVRGVRARVTLLVIVGEIAREKMVEGKGCCPLAAGRLH